MAIDKENNTLWDWVKAISTLLVVGVIVFKIYITPVELTIDFPTLLSLLLALFSVGLASLFYFKATETSNTFYDNTYNFTKDIAQLLSKIESGFGEKLRHLDEGYTSVRDYLQNTPVPRKGTSIEETKTKIDSEKQEIEELLKERGQIIGQLVERSQLQEEEKEKVLNELREKEQELSKAQSELERMNRRLVLERMSRNREGSTVRTGLGSYTRRAVIDEIGVETIRDAPAKVLQSLFRGIMDKLPARYLEDLERHGFLRNGKLTSDGIEFFRSLADAEDV